MTTKLILYALAFLAAAYGIFLIIRGMWVVWAFIPRKRKEADA